MKRIGRTISALLTAVSLMLSGCTLMPETLEEHLEDVISPLPAATDAHWETPVGDAVESGIARVTLHYPGADGTVLTPVTRLFWLNGDQSVETRVAEEMLDASLGADKADAGQMRLAWLEKSMGVVTVNLRSDAEPEETQRVALAAALTATFTGMEGIEGVNLLINGCAVSLGGLPAGTLQGADEPLNRWRQRLTEEAARLESEADPPQRVITVYCPAADGLSVVPETRAVWLDTADGVAAALRELTRSPENENLYSCIPDIEKTMEADPEIELVEGQRVLNVRYAPQVFDALEMSPVERWQFLASQVLTLTSFCPQLDGVRVYFGSYLVTEAPDGRGNMVSFAEGILRRSDFAPRIGSLVGVYRADATGALCVEERVIGWADAGSARALFALLAEEPKQFRLSRAFPEGVSSADLLGVAMGENEMKINLSARFYGLSQSLDAREERLAVYSMVNTFAANGLARAVRFYIEGDAVDTLAGTISLRGALMPLTGA